MKTKQKGEFGPKSETATATEKYSGKVDESIIVSDIIGEDLALNKVVLEIDKLFDKIDNDDRK